MRREFKKATELGWSRNRRDTKKMSINFFFCYRALHETNQLIYIYIYAEKPYPNRLWDRMRERPASDRKAVRTWKASNRVKDLIGLSRRRATNRPSQQRQQHTIYKHTYYIDPRQVPTPRRMTRAAASIICCCAAGSSISRVALCVPWMV